MAGVACLGTPADLTELIAEPEQLVERCVRTGVISTPGFPASLESWVEELAVLRPKEDAELLKGRPLPRGPRRR